MYLDIFFFNKRGTLLDMEDNLVLELGLGANYCIYSSLQLWLRSMGALLPTLMAIVAKEHHEC